MNPLPLAALLERVIPALPKQVPIYLVGGAVRDALMNRASQDLDFLVIGNARHAARSVANTLGADYYPLSESIDAGRVMYFLQPDEGSLEKGRRAILDFTALRAADLDSDLLERDFTVNAMAMDLSTKRIIDPLGGGQDLRKKIIRACSERSFTADPIRIVRAVRLANQFGFQMDPQTLAWLRKALPLLRQCTPERLCEEIMRICGGIDPERAFRILDSLNVLVEIMPEIAALKGLEQPEPHVYDAFGHTLAVLGKLRTLIDMLSPEFTPDPEAGYSTNLIMGLAAARLGRFRDNIGQHFASKDYPEISRKALLIFAALYHDAGKAQTSTVDDAGRIRFYRHEHVGAELVSQRARALHMSNEDSAYLKTVVQQHLRPYLLNLRQAPPTRRSIYRYYRDTGAAGVDICLLALADYLAIYDYTVSQTAWAEYLDVIYSLLENWWFKYAETISPPALINGTDLIERFDLMPGPLIGELLEHVRERQASGEIQTRAEAFQTASERLSDATVRNPRDNAPHRS